MDKDAELEGIYAELVRVGEVLAGISEKLKPYALPGVVNDTGVALQYVRAAAAGAEAALTGAPADGRKVKSKTMRFIES